MIKVSLFTQSHCHGPFDGAGYKVLLQSLIKVSLFTQALCLTLLICASVDKALF
jgi:hypothetical protein